MSNRINLKFLIASSLVSTSIGAYANSVSESEETNRYNGTFQTVIQLNPQPVSKFYAQAKPLTQDALTNTKIITLMRLNPNAKLAAKAEQVASAVEAGYKLERNYASDGVRSFSKSAAAVDLQMNDVPVLDQGQHGTCVTFATTAALDAVLNKGDFIDQQCTLALNLSLGKDYWDGANYASQVIIPLQKYGVVEKNNCPAKYPAPEYKITTNQYSALVDSTVDVKKVTYKYYADLSVNTVRNALKDGHRVAIGFMLKASMDPISVQGFDVKVDGQKKSGGLWACKQPGSTANYCGFAFAGHEVVITGYDDEQSLFKIRNSWSDAVADEGDFYMTYEFFNAMVIDGTEIW